MNMKYIAAALIVVAALVLGYLVFTGPKQGLQTAPIEPKAMSFLEKHQILEPGENLKAYKASGFYTYNEGTVITDRRIFVYANEKVASIPLDKITMVVIRDTHLGHQEVLVAAQQNGAIGVEVYHTSVPELIKMLNVSNTIIKDHTSNKIAEKV